MEYYIKNLSKMSGVSTRTLRYYDEIGLLKPTRINSSNYRIYGKEEVDKLQQIMFYKELDIPLEDIKKIFEDKDFSSLKALESHLEALVDKRDRLESLISTVEKTISSEKGEIEMTDNEKFEAFKDNLIEENSKKYGDEVIAKYGEDSFKESNKKFKNLSKEDFEKGEFLQKKLGEKFSLAMDKNDPTCNEAIEGCKLHKQWLEVFAPYKTISKEYHLGLANMYCEDERFKKYYEDIKVGLAEFMREAMENYYK